MKLKNKKTGEIFEGRVFMSGRIGGEPIENAVTKDGLEDWEDCEEPEKFWYIYGDYVLDGDINSSIAARMIPIGNYFETKEEAEKAVEKLKAWRRLKDNGFKFINWNSEIEGEDHFDCCGMVFINAGFKNGEKCKKDLDLLFGGEDE